MNDLPREVPGETAWERAVNLAGLLAEMGADRLILESGDTRRELKARETDLPRELLAMAQGAAGGTVGAPALGVNFLVNDHAIVRIV